MAAEGDDTNNIYWPEVRLSGAAIDQEREDGAPHPLVLVHITPTLYSIEVILPCLGPQVNGLRVETRQNGSEVHIQGAVNRRPGEVGGTPLQPPIVYRNRIRQPLGYFGFRFNLPGPISVAPPVRALHPDGTLQVYVPRAPLHS